MHNNLFLGFSLMGGGHKNDQIKCKNYDVEIEYEGKMFLGYLDVGDGFLRHKMSSTTSNFCHQQNFIIIFDSGHMKEMIENFNRYQIINESTGSVIKVRPQRILGKSCESVSKLSL